MQGGPPRRCTRRLGVLLLGWVVLSGCDASNQYLLWPPSARAGDTVAVLFNTEWDTTLTPDGALLDAGVENVVVVVSDSSGWTEAIAPRAVIEAPAAPGSVAGVAQGFESVTGLVAIFDLPDPWPNGSIGFPDDFLVTVEHAGSATFGTSQLEVLGSGGSPIVLFPTTPLSELALQPMLRLRPSWDGTSGEGFDPSWEIGGLELTLRYTPGAGDVLSLRALGNGEAAAGIAMATELAPDGGDRLWRIVLIHPPGFQLPEMGCTLSGDCYSGRWSLLDLPLDVDVTGLPQGEPVFVPADFQVEDLRVFDRDGAQLNSAYAGETFFHAYAANNLVALPEPGLLLLLAAGVLGLGFLRALDRRRGPGCAK